MENKMMKAVKNMAIGAVVGAAAVTAGAVYAADNKNMNMNKTMDNVKRTGKKIVRAGRNVMDEMK